MKLILVSVLLIFLASISSNAKAADSDIVINEVLPNPSGSTSEPNEFIELYNKGSLSIDITSWQLSDTQGSVSTYTIPSQSLTAGGYVVFRRETTSIALNNDGDGVVLKNQSGTMIDSMSFGNTSSYEDKSWSRVPDGTGGFISGMAPTEGVSNPSSTPTPAPTASPTPTPTPTPTDSPTPSPAPTATSTPTPTKSPVPTKTPTPRPSLTPTNTPSPEVESTPLVLGLQEVSPSPSPAPGSKFQISKIPFLPLVFIGGGLILVIGSAVTFLKERRRNTRLSANVQEKQEVYDP